ncbi:MAG: RagB/SusD family nutrient uptake outer membrane protein [Bacteroidota bacterium]
MNYAKLSCIPLLFFAVLSCDIAELDDPNGASLNSVLNNASFTELNNVVTGVEATMRNGHDVYVTATGSIAREFYLFDADPRNLTDLMGLEDVESGENAILDNNSFYLTSPYNNRYRVIKNCNILLDAVNNTSVEVTQTNRNGYRGFANTIKAYQLLLVLNLLNSNGIRVDVTDPDNLGSFVPKARALTEIVTLLDLAESQLSDAGSSFSFSLSGGFEGFNDPASFLTFNRAIASRVAIYQEDWNGALAKLEDSFFNLEGDLNIGPKHAYSTAGPDILNNLFKVPNQSGDQIIVNNDWINSADSGDTRVENKTDLRADPSFSGGFTGTHETRLYPSSTSPVDIIRNEELILIYAEAKWKLGELADAERAINVIRTAAGLPDYEANPSSDTPFLDEILHQRRYSLWAEGHRMVDLRRYGRLNTEHVVLDVNLDPDTGEERSQIIFTEFPVPLSDDF